MKTKVLLLPFFLIVLQLSFSDNIIGQLKGITVIDSESDKSNEVILSSEDIFAIVLDKNEFEPVKIQLEIWLSETLKEYPNTFALFFYNSITPLPTEDISSYKGDLVKYIVLPKKSKHFIDIYLKHQPSRNEIIPGTDNITPKDFKNSFFPIVVAMLPVMKGIPDKLLNETIKIKISPFFSENGSLAINVFEKNNSSSDNNLNKISDYKLYIDNNLIEYSDNLVLPTGIRKVRIEKEGYITFEESIVLKSNEKNSLTAYLTRELPYVVIQAPPEAEIFINGIYYKQREFSNLKIGEYTFVFKLGEYSISRKIKLEKSKRYLIDLLLDIDIKEY